MVSGDEVSENPKPFSEEVKANPCVILASVISIEKMLVVTHSSLVGGNGVTVANGRLVEHREHGKVVLPRLSERNERRESGGRAGQAAHHEETEVVGVMLTVINRDRAVISAL